MTYIIDLPLSLAWYVGVAVLYHELLGVRHGVRALRLATVFD